MTLSETIEKLKNLPCVKNPSSSSGIQKQDRFNISILENDGYKEVSQPIIAPMGSSDIDCLIGISRVGKKTIEVLKNNGIATISDLFKNASKITGISGIGKKMTKNILNGATDVSNRYFPIGISSDDIKSGYFVPSLRHRKCLIYQPFGTQNSPDIILIHWGYVIPLEFKSYKPPNTSPVWNGGLPRDNWLYVIADAKRKKQIVLLGQHIMDDQERNELRDFHNQLQAMAKRFNAERQRRKFDYYVRAMYNQISTIPDDNECDRLFREGVRLFTDRF